MRNKLTFRSKGSLVVFAVVFIILVIIQVYRGSLQIFFQQDEWISYGLFLGHGFKYIFTNVSGFVSFILGEGRVFQNFIFFIFFKFFGLNTVPLLTFMLSLHVINSILVFLLSLKIFRKVFPSLLSSLFFAFNSLSLNSVTWTATMGVLVSTTLIFVSIFAFFKFIEENKKKWLILTFIFLYFSLFFKEIGIYLFLFFPFASLIYRKFPFKKFMSTYWPFFLFSVVNVVYRVAELKSLAGNNSALFLTDTISNYWLVLLSRIIFYPITSFSLVFVPSEPFLWLARGFATLYYPFFSSSPQFILIAQTAVLDLLAVVLSILIYILITYLFKFSSKNESRNIKFFAGILFFSYFPYIVISKNFSYLESRYYYLPSIAAAVLLGWIVFKISKRTKLLFFKPIPILLFIVFIGYHLKYLQIGIQRDVAVSIERKSFLEQVKLNTPMLSEDKNIFYFTSNSDYYVSGNKVPFQSGLGYTLMTLYYDNEKIPIELLDQQFLYAIGANDYKEIGGKGFGYFTDMAKLKLALEDHSLNENSVHAFYYDNLDKRLSIIVDPLKN